MVNIIYDNHNRPINYLRLAVTDRCNLRCAYCMPLNIKYLPKKELLDYEEMLRLCNVLAQMGITKVRITGGEPFVRKEIDYFISELNQIKGIEQIHLTTNGTLVNPYIPQLKTMGIKSVNLSLDSLNADRFKKITYSNDFDLVMNSIDQFLKHKIKLKTNMVVMSGVNEQDILPMAALGKTKAINIRFIEEMPFNGGQKNEAEIAFLSYKKIIQKIEQTYGTLQKIEDGPYSTSLNYKIAGFTGSIGVIPAFSRTFCGTCNRIRITAKGDLKTCLYDNGVLNIKNLLRSGITDKELKKVFLQKLKQRPKNGFEAEEKRAESKISYESMSSIGG